MQAAADCLPTKPVQILRQQISSTESDVNIHIEKLLTAIGKSIIWKSGLTEKLNQDFYDRVGTNVWMHYLDSYEMHGEKARWELRKNATFVLNKFWMQHPIKHLLPHGH